MDFMNKAWDQLRDVFGSMTPGARIISALLLAVVVISLGYLFRYSGLGPDCYLMNGEYFTPADIPAMEAAFAAKGLNNYRVEGTRIRVPRAQQDKYMAALAEGNALPYNYLDILERTLKESSSFESRYKLEERMKVALQKELSRVIGQMAGVQSAVVMFDRMTRGGLQRETVTTAGVAVKPVGGQELPDNIVRSIRYYVARSIGGLKPEDVVVTNMDTGANYYASPDEDPQNAAGFYAVKRSWDSYFASQVRTALGYVPGILVSCNVELDPTRSMTQEQVKLDPKVVPLDVTEDSRTRQSDGGTGGRVGYVAQGNTPRALGNNTPSTPTESEEETRRTERNAVGQTVVRQETAGYPIKKVSVSVAVPTSYFRKVWLQSQPADPNGAAAAPKEPTTQYLDKIRTDELAKIRTHVLTLLPQAQDGSDPNQLVTITDFVDMPTVKPTPPGIGEQVLEFVGQYWTTLGLMGLALVSLVVLRSTVQSRAETVAPVASANAAAVAATENEGAEEAGKESKGKKLWKGSDSKSLREELAELVAEDPETAANILKTWIGNPV